MLRNAGLNPPDCSGGYPEKSGTVEVRNNMAAPPMCIWVFIKVIKKLMRVFYFMYIKNI